MLAENLDLSVWLAAFFEGVWFGLFVLPSHGYITP